MKKLLGIVVLEN